MANLSVPPTNASLSPKVGNFFTGYPSHITQIPTKTNQQMDLMNMLGQIGLRGIQNNQNGFAPIEQKARTNFAQQTIPGIAERFSSLGAQNSSAFGQQLGAAGAGLNEGLAGLESQYNLGQQEMFKNLAQLGLGDQFQNQYHQAEPGLLQKIISRILGGQNNQSGQQSSELLKLLLQL